MAQALVLGGATGLLGQSLVRTLTDRGWQVASFGRQDGNLLDGAVINEALENIAPDVVFNTVAWTQVDDAEDHPEEAAAVNAVLPERWASALASRAGHFMQISTDFVFSGQSRYPRKETDAPSPASIYGLTKFQGEKAVQRILPERSAILRTAWLFGPGRKNFVRTILNAAHERDKLTVVDDQTGSPTYTVDLALWCALLAEARATGIWHCVNSGQASWYELASEAIHLASCNSRVEPVMSSAWPQKALRPENSALDNSKLAAFLGQSPRPWCKALRDYIYSENIFSNVACATENN